VKNIELEELFPGGYLRKSSLESSPSIAMSNLRTKLGTELQLKYLNTTRVLREENNKSWIFMKLEQRT